MGYAIIRIAKRSSRAAVRGMLRHALREDAVANAVEGAPRPRPLAGEATSGAALARLSEALKAAPRVRKDTVQALDILVTASHADMASWPKDRQDAYFARALDFISSRVGGRGNILTAVIHRDETTPHMQVLVMPRHPETGRFQAVALIGGPQGLRKLQDDFHAEVGKSFGLQRGERGSKAEHVPIRRFYAQLTSADKPLPGFKEVPPPPTWPQRLSGQAKEIERQRKAALAHNEKVRQALVARVKAAEKIHPVMLARAATTYRAAVHQEQLAKKATAEAIEARSISDTITRRARAEYNEIKKGLEKLKEAAHDVQVKAESTWYIRTSDEFSRHIGAGYRAMLARELGITLRPGKIIDQVRRALDVSALDALIRIEQVAQRTGESFVVSASDWAARKTVEGVFNAREDFGREQDNDYERD